MPQQKGDVEASKQVHTHYNDSDIVPAEMWGKDLTVFKRWFGDISKVTFADVRRYQAPYMWWTKLSKGQLPPIIGEFDQVNELYLDDYKYDSIPDVFTKRSQLRLLSINKSEVKTLPSSIGTLANLTEMRVNFSKLQRLPKEIGELVGLTLLELNGNKLSSLPAEFANLKALKSLG